MSAAFPALGGVITSGVIITSVTVALFSYINSDLKDRWDKASAKLDEIKDIVSDSEDKLHYKQGYDILEQFDRYYESEMGTEHTMRPWLFAMLLIFTAQELSYVAMLHYFPDYMIICLRSLMLSFIALIAILLTASVKMYIMSVKVKKYAVSCGEIAEKGPAILKSGVKPKAS